MSNTENMNEMEKRIEAHLNHEDFMTTVRASDALKARLRSIPVQIGQQTVFVPKRAIWASAAAIAVLVVINITSLSSYKNSDEANTAQEESMTYFSYLEHI